MIPDPLEHPTIDVGWAAKILGINADTAYDLIRADAFPVPVLRLGRKLRVPTHPLLAAIGLA